MTENNYDIEDLFKALADRTRLRLISLIGDSEVCVCYLVEILKISQPKISRHLAYLRRAEIVKARREGKWMHYRLLVPSDPCAATLLKHTLAWLGEDAEMRRDQAQLVRACCRRQTFVRLQTAPLPAPVPAAPPATMREGL